MNERVSAWSLLSCLSALTLCIAPAATQEAPPTVPQNRAADDAGREAALARLQAALQKTADAPTEFTATWGPARDDKVAPIQAFTGQQPAPFEVDGAWSAELLRLRYQSPQQDQLLRRGARLIARDETWPWTRRVGRFADGHELAFLPDPALLLRTLAAAKLDVVNCSATEDPASRLECHTVTLTADQVQALFWSECLPSPPLAGNENTGARNVRRGPAPSPDATIDVAITIDPATAQVHDLKLRSYTNQVRGMVIAGRQLRGVGNAQVFQAQQTVLATPASEGADEAPAATVPKLELVEGLPQRDRTGKTVMELGLRFRRHGKARFEPLTAEQEQLLR